MSLHFDPAHVNHMQAFARGFAELGGEVVFLLHKDYVRFREDLETHGQVVYYAGRRQYAEILRDASLVFIVNPGVANVLLAWWCDRNSIPSAYLYHEPWRGFRYYWKKGVRAQVLALGLRVLTLASLPKIKTVVLASRAALAEYDRWTRRYNTNTVLVPLLFTDAYAGKDEPDSRNRRYVSFIGKAVPEHQFDAFIDYIESALSRQDWEDVEYLIATPSQLGKCALSRLASLRASGRVTVQCGRVLSVAEINEWFRRSLVVWNVYSESMQSGVMAQAFMHGTPVIASRIGSFPEFVVPGVNGELVDSADPDTVLRAVERIRDNLDAYVAGARQSFLSTFFYRAHLDVLKKWIEPMP